MALPLLSDVLAYLEAVDMQGFAPLNIRILRNITLESIDPYLKYLGSRLRLNVQVRYGDYDQILQTALTDSQNLLPGADVILVFLKLETASPALAYRFNTLTPAEVTQEIDRIGSYIDSSLKGIRSQSAAPILWHGFERPAYPAGGIAESQGQTGQLAAVARLNQRLHSAISSQSNSFFIDTDLCLRRVGYDAYYDARYWHMAKAPYSRAALAEIATEDFKVIAALQGKTKKCLVLDCDNVLWGGIVGEDGLDGIQIGATYPGSCYQEFQQELLNLQSRGTLLAVCSKNNPENVQEVFRNHPGMVLKEEHLSAQQINWDDKVTNLRRLAEQLHIGLDSLVFADDSEFEIGLVRQMLPEVEILALPAKEPQRFREILARCGWFDSLHWTDEDRKRTKMYASDAQRKDQAAKFTDLAGYLRSLEMVVTIQPATESVLPRIAQLSQKTNQFNLTTRRYSEDQLRDIRKDERNDVLYLAVTDRFGDSGIVGAAVLTSASQVSTLENLFLSCRILGRQIEDIFLDSCLEVAKRRGAQTARGLYRPSAKNNQVKDFYEKRSFARKGPGEDAIEIFERDLGSFQFKPADYLKELRFPGLGPEPAKTSSKENKNAIPRQ